MGNCQAIDAATLVIQHPSGKVDKFYWPVSACEVMRMNPGHYVALLISTTLCPTTTTNASNNNKEKEECPSNSNNSTTSSNTDNNGNGNSVRLTRIKLLRPTDTLVLGQVYRLITNQDVMKGLSAKKHAKMSRNRTQSAEKPERVTDEKPKRSELEKDNQMMKHERHRPRTTASASANSANSAAARSRMWQPSLQSISEAGS